jgi:hypothetical protein
LERPFRAINTDSPKLPLMAFFPAVNSLLQKAVKKNIGSIQKQ